MSKGLEALETMISNGYVNPNVEELKVIETELNEKVNIENRLNEIFENHNIKSFTELNERLCDYNELKFDDDVKQKKLKALEIIKEKRVNVDWLLEVDFDLERYNRHIAPFHRYALNTMEIKILKEVLL